MNKYGQSNEVLNNNKDNSKEIVLVIEDELCCAISLQLLLQSFGCEVVLASNGEEGFALLHQYQKSINLILLDIMMPGMTGIDFLIEANSTNVLGNIPVVIQSAEEYETILHALNKGACGYVHKPYVRGEIYKMVERFVRPKILEDFHRALPFIGMSVNGKYEIIEGDFYA